MDNRYKTEIYEFTSIEIEHIKNALKQYTRDELQKLASDHILKRIEWMQAD